MFKFVVLCAFVVAASATPGALFASLPYVSPAVVPAPAVYSSLNIYSPSVVSAAPLAYPSYGYSHFIKKRSAPLALSSYITPSTYYGSAPLINSWTGGYAAPYATTYGSLATPYLSPLYSGAHLIKKRSAPFIVPSTYLASTPYAAAPFVGSTYAAAGPIVSSPYYSTAPLAYSHFIKK